MIKLCFGTFMSVLVQYKSVSVTQKKLCGKFLGLIDQNWDISDDDGVTSKLINGYSNLSAGITDLIAENNPKDFCDRLRNDFLLLLDPNSKDRIISAILGIVENDDDINDNVTVELMNRYTKKEILAMNKFVFEEFITGIFWYVANYTSNANEYVKQLKVLGIDSLAENKKDVSVEKTELSSITIENDRFVEKKRFSVKEKNITIAILLGEWDESFEGDRNAASVFWGERAQTFTKEVRVANEKWHDLFKFKNRKWKVANHKKSLLEIAENIFDDDIDHIFELAKEIYGEVNPKYDLPADKRHLSSLYNRDFTFVYSKNIRHGLGDTIALICNNIEAFVNCSENKILNSVYTFERELFEKKDWKFFASLSDSYDFLGESCPDVFLEQIELLLNEKNTEFVRYFMESETFIIKENYGFQLAEIVHVLARKEEFFARCIRILFLLSLVDNKYENTIVQIVLPWLPQTEAGPSVRIGVFKGLARIDDNQTWKILMKLMPNATTSSSMPIAPKYISVLKLRESIPYKELYETSRGYIELACKMLDGKSNRIIEFFDVIDDVDIHLRQSVLEALKENIWNLSEPDLEMIWNKKQDFVARHRRFADAKWSLQEEQLLSIDNFFDDVFKKVSDYEFVRLFRVEQYKLMTEFSKADEDLLFNMQLQSMEKAYHSEGIEGIIRKLPRVGSPFLYGTFVAKVISENDALELLEKHNELSKSDFIQGFLNGTTPEIRNTIINHCTISEKPIVLACQPTSSGILSDVKELPMEMQLEFFRHINIWRIEALTLDEYEFVLNSLSLIDRISECVWFLYNQINKDDCCLNSQRIWRFLMEKIDTDNIARVDIYQLQQLIIWLQKNLVDSDALFKVEWKFLAIFDENDGLQPITIWRKLADEPDFFMDIIKVICGKDNYEYSEEERQKVVQQCIGLMNAWKRIPGLIDDGSFDYSIFENWYKTVRKQSLEVNVETLALDYIGKVVFHAPKDIDFFINRNLAGLVESENIEQIRIGYEIEAINSRGVHNVDITGETEFSIERNYLKLSKMADAEGYIRFAETLRNIARSYHFEGLKNIKYGKRAVDEN